jgi:hypothetical protein
MDQLLASIGEAIQAWLEAEPPADGAPAELDTGDQAHSFTDRAVGHKTTRLASAKPGAKTPKAGNHRLARLSS